MNENLLIIFAKYPEPGKVKNRLAAELGTGEAVRVYAACAEKVLAAAASAGSAAGYDTAIACWPPKKLHEMTRWLDPGIPIRAQRGADLGSRMQHAFAEGFSAGHKKIAIIGTDCPAVTQELICRAFALLDSRDAAIGPAADGGYYLIGLRRPVSVIFENIPWSTGRVLSLTLERLAGSSMTCGLLPQLVDIDRPEDLEYYRRRGLQL